MPGRHSHTVELDDSAPGWRETGTADVDEDTADEDVADDEPLEHAPANTLTTTTVTTATTVLGPNSPAPRRTAGL